MFATRIRVEAPTASATPRQVAEAPGAPDLPQRARQQGHPALQVPSHAGPGAQSSSCPGGATMQPLRQYVAVGGSSPLQ